MAKVKIVQIALAESEESSQAEYLDDQGRVWFQVRRSKSVKPTEENDYTKTEYFYVWKQLELPEEPNE